MLSTDFKASWASLLFRRGRNGLEPTADAHRLAPEFKQALAWIDSAFAPSEEFTMGDFGSAGFVALGEDLARFAHINQEARSEGLTRAIVCTVNHMWSVATMVANSDLVGMVGRNMAAPIAEQFNLKMFPPPINAPQHSWHLNWHSDFDREAGHMWLRNLIRSIASGA